MHGNVPHAPWVQGDESRWGYPWSSQIIIRGTGNRELDRTFKSLQILIVNYSRVSKKSLDLEQAFMILILIDEYLKSAYSVIWRVSNSELPTYFEVNLLRSNLSSNQQRAELYRLFDTEVSLSLSLLPISVLLCLLR